MSLLQIYQWICQRKNFKKPLTFGEVMGKSLVSCFFLTHSVVPTDELGTYDDGDDDVLQASGDDRCRMQLTVVRLIHGDRRWLGFATHGSMAKSKPKVTSLAVYKHDGRLGSPGVEQVASRLFYEWAGSESRGRATPASPVTPADMAVVSLAAVAPRQPQARWRKQTSRQKWWQKSTLKTNWSMKCSKHE